MRGDIEASGARYAPVGAPRRWPSWLTELRSRRKRARTERLVLAERLASERRSARRGAEHAPKLPTIRPW